MSKNSLKKFRSVGLSLISGLALFVIVWLLLYGKIKASEIIAPIFRKIPKSEEGLSKLTEQVLGEAVKKVSSGETKKVVEKGAELFETSQYAQPAREIRENVIQRVNEVVSSVKELPAQEIRIIKNQVCKEWLEEVATESGRN